LRQAGHDGKLISTEEERPVEPANTKRQRSAERTQEVRAIDILEETPIEGEVSVEVDLGSMAVAPVGPGYSGDTPKPPGGAPSLSPIAVAINPGRRPPADSTYQIQLPRPPRRRLGPVVAGAMGLSVCILLLATIRARSAEAPARAGSQPAETSGSPGGHPLTPGPQAARTWDPAPATIAGAKPARDWVPAPAAPEAVPTSGTVTSRGGALFVDGSRMSAKSAVVACGHHQLRVGRGKSHDADVPCGATLVVDRSGKMTVKGR
jgi:hypothetical protein